MNRAFSFAAISLTLLAVGCGGSSVQSKSVNQNTVALGPATIEAVVMQAGSATDPYLPVVEDTMNIQVSELLEFQVVAYDAAGGRHVLAATNWRWSDTSNQFGTLDPNSGLFSVGQSSMPTSGYVNVTLVSTNSATPSGSTVSVPYLVNPNQARVIGMVIGSDTGKGMRGIKIDFFDANLNQTDEVQSSYDGTFRASTKLSAVQFTVNPDSIPSTYWQQFFYGQNPLYPQNPTTQPPLESYDAGSNTCMTPFQTLYNRTGGQIGTTLVQGENFLFAPAQPSVLLEPVTPANPNDPNLIVISSKATYQVRPTSNGCG